MDDQPVLIGIDVRDAGMAAFEMQPGWRDNSFQQVQRRARRADPLRGRVRRWWKDPDDLVLES
jgi:hypothetical protein